MVHYIKLLTKVNGLGASSRSTVGFWMLFGYNEAKGTRDEFHPVLWHTRQRPYRAIIREE
jgi:hypothetical protein